MTIPTPTSEVQSPLDLRTLASLANEFFAALPGDVPAVSGNLPSSTVPGTSALGGVTAPTNVLPAGSALGPISNGPQTPGTYVPGSNMVPQSPQSAVSMVASTPALVPHAAAPNGLPDNLATVSPAVDGRLGGTVLGAPQAYADLQEAPVNASGLGFPGLDDIKALLQGIDHRQPSAGVDHKGIQAPVNNQSTYYFASPQRQSHGFAERVPQADESRHPAFDVNAVRRDFPILQERVNGRYSLARR